MSGWREGRWQAEQGSCSQQKFVGPVQLQPVDPAVVLDLDGLAALQQRFDLYARHRPNRWRGFIRWRRRRWGAADIHGDRTG